jgi:nucleoid DNA-binding protein
MNRSELVEAVARKQRLRPELVDAVLTSFFDMVTLCLSVDEEVSVRGFGKFKTRMMRGVNGLSNPHTRTKHNIPDRRIASFISSAALKDQLNGDEAVLQEARQSLVALTTKTRGKRRMLNEDALHRYLWNRADGRGRVAVKITQLAETLSVSYETANKAVIRMRNDGRIRHVGYNGDASKVYEIADPDAWQADDASTHARYPAAPLWG